jgi:hypothetical protein
VAAIEDERVAGLEHVTVAAVLQGHLALEPFLDLFRRLAYLN